MDKSTFRRVPSAHILQREDKSFFRIIIYRPVRNGADILAVRLEGVRCAREQDGVRVVIALGHIYGREKTHAIAHRDIVFIFRVVFLQVGQFGGNRGPRGSSPNESYRNANKDDLQRKEMDEPYRLLSSRDHQA